eukprot:8786696-Alexandrium_andersonii.AAC.1
MLAHTHMFAHTHMVAHTHVQTHAHAHAHVHVHAHAHAHTHAISCLRIAKGMNRWHCEQQTAAATLSEAIQTNTLELEFAPLAYGLKRRIQGAASRDAPTISLSWPR